MSQLISLPVSFSNTLVQLGMNGVSGYDAQLNMLLSNIYTSQAGNSYYSGLRASDELIVIEDIGQGQPCKFLNGLKIYARASKILLAEERYNKMFYSTHKVDELSCKLLEYSLQEVASRQGKRLPTAELSRQVHRAVGTLRSVGLPDMKRLMLGA